MTLPTELREVLSIDDGDLVEFEVVGIVRRSSAAKRDSFPSPSSNAPVPVES